MSLKIVHKICCGLDVHQSFVVACIATTNNKGVTTYKRHRFSTFTAGLRKLLQWLLDNNCKDVCMESTGKYWIPVFNVLENDCNVVLAHPKYLKAIKGKKTDKKDAKWIADLFKHDLLEGSFMPTQDIRNLRDLMRYRFKLTCFSSSEKNRLQNSLTASNIQIANAVSDTFGKSAQNILTRILEDPEDSSFDINPLIHGSMKGKVPELELAIDDFIDQHQAGKIKVIKHHFQDLQARKSELEKLILDLATPYQTYIDLILSMPSIKNVFTAITIISEIGVDMNQFPTSKHLCSWDGLTPTNDESASKKKFVSISKAGCYLKPLLVQCANAAIKSKKNPEFRNRYLRIKKCKGHKRAIIAIARMILTIIYQMFKTGELYNSEYHRKDNMIPVNREITIEQAILLAKSQGYSIKSDSS